MNGALQSTLRKLTQATRPIAMRTAGTAGSNTSIIRHVGRRTGRSYATPVVAVQHGDTFLIALPYGERTDWLKNVLANGKATLISQGRSYEVDEPRVMSMSRATAYFGPKEQRLHRRFGVDSCLEVRHPAP